jgi:hypothetical protein
MLSSKEFKSSSEWQKLETEILKRIAEETDNTIQLASEGKQSCQATAATCKALAWVLMLPDVTLTNDEKKDDKPAEGVSIAKLARKGTALW